MESELKQIDPNSSNTSKPPSIDDDDSSSKDDRPLLLKSSPPQQQQQELKHHHQESTKVSSREEIQELEKKFAAYVRNDVYGTMGLGELPLKEKLLTGFALVTLLPVRVLCAMVILVAYYLVCRVCTLFLVPNREEENEQEDYAHMGGWRRAVIVHCGRFAARAMLFTFGFYTIKETRANHRDHVDKLTHDSQNRHEESGETERPGVIISNHVSYLDILYHMSSTFPSFVAKRSVAKLPLVGLISKCLGCVYVQRESKSSDFKGVSGVVTERVREAHLSKDAPMIMLFPEGTTTNGDYLLPFKTGAFLAID